MDSQNWIRWMMDDGFSRTVTLVDFRNRLETQNGIFNALTMGGWRHGWRNRLTPTHTSYLSKTFWSTNRAHSLEKKGWGGGGATLELLIKRVSSSSLLQSRKFTLQSNSTLGWVKCKDGFAVVTQGRFHKWIICFAEAVLLPALRALPQEFKSINWLPSPTSAIDRINNVLPLRRGQ